MLKNYDIIIIGGGLTGLTLACALAKQSIRIGIIVADNSSSKEIVPNKQDLRSLALSHISHRIFEGLQLWSTIGKKAYPIEQIHISDKGHFGFTHLAAYQHHLQALGYVISIEDLFNGLKNNVQKHAHIEFINAKIIDCVTADRQTVVYLDSKNASIQATAKLIVAADGENSFIRHLLSIKPRIWDYRQTAIVANVGLQNRQKAIAYERFTEFGPLALLPLGEQFYSLTWTTLDTHAKLLATLPEKEFLRHLQTQFGYRLGKFVWLGQRQSFPLRLIRTDQQTHKNIVLIGNASQTIHPIAGQGFNLGLRDVAVLTQVIADSLATGKDLTDPEIVTRYSKERLWDQRLTIGVTDSLVRLFSNNYHPLALLRNLGLVGLDLLPGVKQQFSRRAMGFISGMPNLMLGLPA
jgi:2-octaprenyl-6-methoxyphenol hydroxylase